MSVVPSPMRHVVALMSVALSVSCIGQKLFGEVQGTQIKLQRAIRDGSKSPDCAPKATAIAEANIRFAQDALAMGEVLRGRRHADIAAKNTELAVNQTDPERCRVYGDRDGDGLADNVDQCPDASEDPDAFEDEDGCPDLDNDGDGIPDESDRKGEQDCRNDREDVDRFEDEDGCPDPDNDQDGVLDESDECPLEPEDPDQFADEDGCPDPDNDGDKFCDPWVTLASDGNASYECEGSDECPNEPEDIDGDQDEDGCPDLKAAFDGCSVVITDKVFFKSNKWEIAPRSYELLGDVATVMSSVPDELHFRVEGHTDSRGSSSYNRKLSQRRADRVADYLIGRGIARERLQALGVGEDSPIDTNRTSAGRARNRRVEFNVSNAECKRDAP